MVVVVRPCLIDQQGENLIVATSRELFFLLLDIVSIKFYCYVFFFFYLETEFADVGPLESGAHRLRKTIFFLFSTEITQSIRRRGDWNSIIANNNNDTYLVDVDTSAANAQPHSAGVLLLLLLVVQLDGIVVGRTRPMMCQPFQRRSRVGG